MTNTKAPDKRKSKATYQPPQRLELPPEVVDRFANEGYALRWIRILSGQQMDRSHISKRKREGYVFVTPAEAGDVIEHLGLLPNEQEGMVVNGDLALAKILFENQEARQKYYEDLARMNAGTLTRQFETDRVDGTHLLVENKSRSRVGTGRHAKLES